MRDDVSYLFLADRVAPSQPQAQAGLDGPANLLDDEAFEMVDSDPAGQRFPEQPEPPALSIGKGAPTYRTLAVRPAGNVLPLLHNLMSGFVLGLTKSARAVRLFPPHIDLPLNLQKADNIPAGSVYDVSSAYPDTPPRSRSPTHFPHLPRPKTSKPANHTHHPHPTQPHGEHHLSRGGIRGIWRHWIRSSGAQRLSRELSA